MVALFAGRTHVAERIWPNGVAERLQKKSTPLKKVVGTSKKSSTSQKKADHTSCTTSTPRVQRPHLVYNVHTSCTTSSPRVQRPHFT